MLEMGAGPSFGPPMQLATSSTPRPQYMHTSSTRFSPRSRRATLALPVLLAGQGGIPPASAVGPGTAVVAAMAAFHGRTPTRRCLCRPGWRPQPGRLSPGMRASHGLVASANFLGLLIGLLLQNIVGHIRAVVSKRHIRGTRRLSKGRSTISAMAQAASRVTRATSSRTRSR